MEPSINELLRKLACIRYAINAHVYCTPATNHHMQTQHQVAATIATSTTWPMLPSTFHQQVQAGVAWWRNGRVYQHCNQLPVQHRSTQEPPEEAMVCYGRLCDVLPPCLLASYVYQACQSPCAVTRTVSDGALLV